MRTSHGEAGWAGGGGGARGEVPGLTALRGIAALMVCVMHLAGSFPGLGAGTIQLVDRAWLAVELFLLMSGFIVHHVYAGTFARGVTGAAYADFMVSRLARIWPLAMVALLLSVLLHLLASGQAAIPLEGPRSLVAGAETALLVNGLVPGARWNYPSWSISAEMANYLLAPFLIAAVHAAGRRTLLLAAAGCLLPIALVDAVELLLARDEGRLFLALGPFWLDVQGPARPHLDFVEGLPVVGRCLPMFVLGAILARLHSEGRLRRLGNDHATLGAALLVVASLQLATLSLLTVSGFLLLVAGAAGGGGRRTLESAPLRWLGEVSFGLYMVHAPIQLALHDLLERLSLDRASLAPGTAWPLLLLTSGLVLLAAHLACRHVERPARAAIRNAWAARLAAPALATAG